LALATANLLELVASSNCSETKITNDNSVFSYKMNIIKTEHGTCFCPVSMQLPVTTQSR